VPSKDDSYLSLLLRWLPPSRRGVTGGGSVHTVVRVVEYQRHQLRDTQIVERRPNEERFIPRHDGRAPYRGEGCSRASVWALF
jgi:hypothetical protein